MILSWILVTSSIVHKSGKVKRILDWINWGEKCYCR